MVFGFPGRGDAAASDALPPCSVWRWCYSFRRQNQARIEERLQAGRAADRGTRRQAVGSRAHRACRRRPHLPGDGSGPSRLTPREQLALAQSACWVHYPEGDPGQFSALLIIGYAHLALHDAQAATQAFETARQIALQEHLYFGVVESTFHLARLAHSKGQLRQAAEICQQGQADIASLLAHPEQELPALGCLDIALGSVLLEQNRLDEAERTSSPRS